MGIEISHFSNFNTITRNKIIKGICLGIELYDSTENNIFLNSIEIIDSNWIFIIVNSFDNTISQNNFIINGFYHVISVDSDNIWDGNYWVKSMILPRFIPIYHDNYILPYIFDLDVDWHPAKEPYDV
jgi:parallel beta-helix repeat protein